MSNDAQQSDFTVSPFLFFSPAIVVCSCCVDEVAAQHVNADLVVHYGHACLSPTARLPVIYVFPKRLLNVEETVSKLSKAALETLDSLQSADDESTHRMALLLSYDVGYAHAAGQVFDDLQAHFRGVRISQNKPLPPLVMSELDTGRNFEDKVQRQGNAPGHDGHMTTAQREQSNECGACHQNSSLNGMSQSCCNGGSADGCSCSSAPLPRAAPAETQGKQSASIQTLAGSDGSGRLYHLPPGVDLSSTLILYIGGESLALTNLLLRAGPTTPVIAFDPYLSQPPNEPSSNGPRRMDGRTNKLLMRRYAAVQKARDASVVGLLVGTLGVQSYLPLLGHLRRRLTGKNDDPNGNSGGGGRKVYTISVGKLSPAKLANFQEVDIFVLLACPENSLVDAVDVERSREFYRPIVTPFEMLLALDEREGRGRSWDGQYVLEMERLLASRRAAGDVAEGGEGDEKDGNSDEDEDAPHFSLVTGGYVQRRRYHDTHGPSSSTGDSHNDNDDVGTVALRDSSGHLIRHVLDSASARHLASRSWTGLDPTRGDAPAVLEEGRQGIANGYADAEGTKEG